MKQEVFEPGVKERWRSRHDESGESTVEEDVTDAGREESELERLGWGWRSETVDYFHGQIVIIMCSAVSSPSKVVSLSIRKMGQTDRQTDRRTDTRPMLYAYCYKRDND